MANLDSVLKCRDITLLVKVSIIKAMVFPVVMCGCESWTIKKAEHKRMMLERPLNCKEIKPILKEINPEYSLEGLMLKLQYFGHLILRADTLGKTLMLGKIEGK